MHQCRFFVVVILGMANNSQPGTKTVCAFREFSLVYILYPVPKKIENCTTTASIKCHGGRRQHDRPWDDTTAVLLSLSQNMPAMKWFPGVLPLSASKSQVSTVLNVELNLWLLA